MPLLGLQDKHILVGILENTVKSLLQDKTPTRLQKTVITSKQITMNLYPKRRNEARNQNTTTHEYI